jgi:hypothetical protein
MNQLKPIVIIACLILGGCSKASQQAVSPATIIEPMELIDASGGHRPFNEGTSVPYGAYTLEATANAETLSVRFTLDGKFYNVDSEVPFQRTDFSPGVGTHQMIAIPYSGKSGGGTAGPSVTVNFTVTQGGTPAPSPTPNPTATTTPNPTATPSPGGGIADKYPGDGGIANDPAVILADDFERYTATDWETLKTQLEQNWTKADWARYMSISDNAFAGKKAIQFSIPITTTEIGQALIKDVANLDSIYARIYCKWAADYDINTSNHNGISIKGGDYKGAGSTPNGTDFFIMYIQNNDLRQEGPPGWLHEYAYWPNQNGGYGDHWYPDGQGFIRANNQVPDFKPLPNFKPERDRWYCYEQMVRLNTVGKKDGEVKVWVDGTLKADWPGIYMRTVDTLKIEQVLIGLHALKAPRLTLKWYDNAVIATDYIGPMKPGKPTPTPSATPSVSPTPTATATPTPTPTATPLPTATPTATPSPTATITPSPSATVTPAVSLVTVTVSWTATVGDEYSVFYGKTAAADEMQVYGGKAWAAGPMSVAVAGLQPGTTYYFSITATRNGVTGPKLQPSVSYITKTTPNQTVKLP